MYQTKLADLIYDIMEDHVEGMTKAFEWMELWGADLWNGAATDARRAEFNLTVHHENDYVEDGPFDPDPDHNHYYVFSWSEVTVRVPLIILQQFLLACRKGKYSFDELDKRTYQTLPENVRLDTDTGNQFTMESRIHFNDYSHDSCEIRLCWHVFHDFNER